MEDISTSWIYPLTTPFLPSEIIQWQWHWIKRSQLYECEIHAFNVIRTLVCNFFLVRPESSDINLSGWWRLLISDKECRNTCMFLHSSMCSYIAWETLTNQKLRNYHMILSTNEGRCKDNFCQNGAYSLATRFATCHSIFKINIEKKNHCTIYAGHMPSERKNLQIHVVHVCSPGRNQ